MTCVLRVYGKHLDIDEVSKNINLVPYRINRGEGGAKKSINIMHYDICQLNAAVDIEIVASALRRNFLDYEKFQTMDGFEGADLDIQFSFREGDAMKNLFLPKTLIDLSSKLGFSINVSVYSVSEGL